MKRWHDEELKVLSLQVVAAAPDDLRPNQMCALVLSGVCDAWEVGPRTAAEVKAAAKYMERAAELCPTVVGKTDNASKAQFLHRLAEDHQYHEQRGL